MILTVKNKVKDFWDISNFVFELIKRNTQVFVSIFISQCFLLLDPKAAKGLFAVMF